MEDGEKLNFLKLRNVIVHGSFFVFVAIYLGSPVANSFKEFDGNIKELIINVIIVVLVTFICIWYPISKYLLGQNHLFKKHKAIRVILLDIPCVIGMVLVFLYPWYTALNYFLGFTNYFKQDKVLRFVFLDIPFLLSLLFLTYLRFFDNSTGDASAIVVIPVFGYYPYSIMYYILAPLVILVYQGLKPTK